jgi:hypothetical protein
LDALRCDGTLRLSEGSCQCLLTILFLFLETCVGSVLGNTVDTDLTDLTSGLASFVYDSSSLSAFIGGSFIVVPAVALTDESATVSVEETSRETSAFAKGTTGETSALT